MRFRTFCWLSIFCTAQSLCTVLAGGQSLAEAARREAERRRLLEEQGIVGKVVSGEAAKSSVEKGNVTVFKPASKGEAKSARPTSSKRSSPEPFRKKLEKLDREIRDSRDRHDQLLARIRSALRPAAGAGRSGGSGGAAVERWRLQAEEVEKKIRRLQEDRRRTYEEGRKAGFLPGELDGRGIIP